MNVLVFDIGGTAIKYGRYVDGVLTDVQECPTDAKRGGRGGRTSKEQNDRHSRAICRGCFFSQIEER